MHFLFLCTLAYDSMRGTSTLLTTSAPHFFSTSVSSPRWLATFTRATINVLSTLALSAVTSTMYYKYKPEVTMPLDTFYNASSQVAAIRLMWYAGLMTWTKHLQNVPIKPSSKVGERMKNPKWKLLPSQF